MASPNTNWSELLTTTLYKRGPRLSDNVSKNNGLLARLNEKGRKSMVDGGAALTEPLDYSENNNYKRYSGYDVLNVSPSDVMTSAQYEWKQAAVSVTISGYEEMANSGEEAIIDLMKGRIENAERTMRNNLSSDFYSDGTADSGKQVGGLQLLVADVSTSGTVGGINRATWPFWRNTVKSFATEGLTPGAATMQTMMNRTWEALVRGADKPDLIIADNVYWRYYLESLQAIQRITSDSRAMAGFQSLKFMTADVVFDGGFQGVAAGQGSNIDGNGITWTSGTGSPSNHMYFLNTDFLKLKVHRRRDMVPLAPDRFAVNQDAMVRLIGWAGNLVLSNAFMQGVITA